MGNEKKVEGFVLRWALFEVRAALLFEVLGLRFALLQVCAALCSRFWVRSSWSCGDRARARRRRGAEVPGKAETERSRGCSLKKKTALTNESVFLNGFMRFFIS
jgi:hypothetical protein